MNENKTNQALGAWNNQSNENIEYLKNQVNSEIYVAEALLKDIKKLIEKERVTGYLISSNNSLKPINHQLARLEKKLRG